MNISHWKSRIIMFYKWMERFIVQHLIKQMLRETIISFICSKYYNQIQILIIATFLQDGVELEFQVKTHVMVQCYLFKLFTIMNLNIVKSQRKEIILKFIWIMLINKKKQKISMIKRQINKANKNKRRNLPCQSQCNP